MLSSPISHGAFLLFVKFSGAKIWNKWMWNEQHKILWPFQFSSWVCNWLILIFFPSHLSGTTLASSFITACFPPPHTPAPHPPPPPVFYSFYIYGTSSTYGCHKWISLTKLLAHFKEGSKYLANFPKLLPVFSSTSYALPFLQEKKSLRSICWRKKEQVPNSEKVNVFKSDGERRAGRRSNVPILLIFLDPTCPLRCIWDRTSWGGILYAFLWR